MGQGLPAYLRGHTDLQHKVWLEWLYPETKAKKSGFPGITKEQMVKLRKDMAMSRGILREQAKKGPPPDLLKRLEKARRLAEERSGTEEEPEGKGAIDG